MKLQRVVAAGAVLTTVIVPAPQLNAEPLTTRERICFEVEGAPGDLAFVNLTPVEASGPGFGVLVSSDVVNPPLASNVNFDVGTVDPNVGTAPIGADGRVCFLNSVHNEVHLVADVLAVVPAAWVRPPSLDGTPVRYLDTRVGFGGDRLVPADSVCWSVDAEAGDLALVNLTPVGADGPGFGVIFPADQPRPRSSIVNYDVGTVDPNLGAVIVGEAGRICFGTSNGASVDLVADHVATIDRAAISFAGAGGSAVRVVDTRVGLGGDRIPAGKQRCFLGAENGLAIANLTPTDPSGPGFGSMGGTAISSVNYRPGAVDPNMAFVTWSAFSGHCYRNSEHADVDLVVDHLATLLPGTYDLISRRAIDTRFTALALRDTTLATPPGPASLRCMYQDTFDSARGIDVRHMWLSVGTSPFGRLTAVAEQFGSVDPIALVGSVSLSASVVAPLEYPLDVGDGRRVPNHFVGRLEVTFFDFDLGNVVGIDRATYDADVPCSLMP